MDRWIAVPWRFLILDGVWADRYVVSEFDNILTVFVITFSILIFITIQYLASMFQNIVVKELRSVTL